MRSIFCKKAVRNTLTAFFLDCLSTFKREISKGMLESI
jgi:hypothetical protein